MRQWRCSDSSAWPWALQPACRDLQTLLSSEAVSQHRAPWWGLPRCLLLPGLHRCHLPLGCGPLSPPSLPLFLPKAESGGGMNTCRAGVLFFLSSFPLPLTWGPLWGPPCRPSVARHTLLLLAECSCCYPLIFVVGPTPLPGLIKTPGRHSDKPPFCSCRNSTRNT